MHIQKSLFHQKNQKKPLAEDLKPADLESWVGQEHLLENPLIHSFLYQPKKSSLLLWGPPGSGKTSFARIAIKILTLPSFELSATSASSKDLKKLGEDARDRFLKTSERTLVFVDEVHRFNKGQQDVLLPFIEDGSFLFIGATTENPSFELNAALLSRLHVLRLNRHNEESLKKIFTRAKKNKALRVNLTEEALTLLCLRADGDARFFLNLLESVEPQDENLKNIPILGKEELEKILPVKLHFHDKDRDQHYDLISALHKSVRASDLQATLYWLERMLEAGEDRRFILRRLIRMASEDIGLADPQALMQCTCALSGYELLGSPEGDLLIVQAAMYLAASPKSNSIYTAQKQVRNEILQSGQLEVPYFLRNAVTKLMKDQDYAKGYRYDHDYPWHYSGQNCLPEKLSHKTFYEPGELGFEKEIQKRLEFFEKIKKAPSK